MHVFETYLLGKIVQLELNKKVTLTVFSVLSMFARKFLKTMK